MESFAGYTVSQEVAVLLEDVQALAAKAQSMWKFDLTRLDGAKTEQHTYLELFCASLDKSPVFSKMPPLPGYYEYLWATFLKDGEPGTERYEAGWDAEGDMHGLTLSEVFVVQAASDADDALWALLHHERACGKQAGVDAANYLLQAKSSIESGKKAIAFVEAHGNLNDHGKKVCVAKSLSDGT